jgi:RHS repeat-associated protein
LAHLFAGASTVTAGFGYDGAHRVTSQSSSDASWLWTSPVGATTAYGTANAVDQYPTVGGNTLSWDSNGNLAAYNGFTFTHDSENRLTAASKTNMSAAYAYDALDRRVKKSGTGVAAAAFLSAGAEEIADYAIDGGGSFNLVQRYVPAAATDERAAIITAGGTVTYPQTDRQGSTVATASASGAVAEGPYTYDPYGNCTTAAGTPCAVTANPWRYTGRRLDPETGLLYYRARYYAPDIGRFIETDPVGSADFPNLYAYVHNDPVDGSDPSGMVNKGDSFCEMNNGCNSVWSSGYGDGGGGGGGGDKEGTRSSSGSGQTPQGTNGAGTQVAANWNDSRPMTPGEYERACKMGGCHGYTIDPHTRMQTDAAARAMARDVTVFIATTVGPIAIIKGIGAAGSLARVDGVADSVMDFLGPGTTKVESGSDLMLRSADRMRTIRFDIVNSHGLDPHINIEFWENAGRYPGDTRMIQIYRPEVPPHIFVKP